MSTPMTNPMTSLWWAQIKAVMRLELKKTFFARRGLWIYVLAALPVALFMIFAVVSSREQDSSARIARQGEKALTSQDLRAIRPGMTREEVISILGKPFLITQWHGRRPAENGSSVGVLRENYHYSDGQDELFVSLVDDKVESVTIREGYSQGQDSIMFAGVFQFFFLRLAVFFGCLGIFMNLFRGEILDRSLHFYFLAPIRREVLMAGKFLAGFLATCTIFVTSEVLQTIAFLGHFSPAARDLYLYQNHGLEHAAQYVGVTVLACLGYGAFFLVAGMLFRNPIQPTAAALLWEGINPFLPSVLKQISVIYYLKSLCPVNIPVSPGTSPLWALLVSNSDPVAAPLAVAGVVTVALLALFISSVQVRRMEINYTTE
jgi:ABC-type transport system involved in multi-copper enzyme maturation permease subunit